MKVELKGIVVFIEKNVESTFKNDDGTTTTKNFDRLTIQQETGKQAKVKTACGEFKDQKQFSEIKLLCHVNNWSMGGRSGMSWQTDKYKGA